MDLAEICRAVGYSLLLAGFLFIARWWVETKGKDRTSRDRRIAFVLIGASMVCTLLAILFGQGGGS
jgi:inner membrane protein involved in colicin E2 resistance